MSRPFETAEEHNAAIKRQDEHFENVVMPVMENPVIGGMTAILILGGGAGVALGAAILFGKFLANGMMP